jgi:arylsulfatase
LSGPILKDFNDFFSREAWRFVPVQQYVEKPALTPIEYPPMQKPAPFNLQAVKEKVQAMIEHKEGQ